MADWLRRLIATLAVRVRRRRAAPENPLREFYLRYGCCMAYVAVERNGVAGIGSAFHVGEGVFVTARHVVEGATITEMRVTDADLFYRSGLHQKCKDGIRYTIGPDAPRICSDPEGLLTVVGQPGFHSDPQVDVAVLRTSGIEPNARPIDKSCPPGLR